MADEPTEIDTTNKFLVAGGMGPNRQPQIHFLRPLPAALSHAEALLLAAYLVSMVGDDEQWQRVLTAVQHT